MAFMRMLTLRIILAGALALLAGCSQPKPSAEDAKKFLDSAEVKLNDLVQPGDTVIVSERFF